MQKKINTLIARALLLGVFSSFLALSNVHADISNASNNVVQTAQAITSFSAPSAPQVAPPSPAPAPQVAEAPPPANNEFVLQKAARN